MCRVKLLIIFSLLWPCISQASPYHFKGHENEPLTTEIRMLTPFTTEGVNSQLKITKETKGTCWASSFTDSARPNTWRCRADNEVHDPCFKNPVKDQQSVVCMKSPWEKSAVLVKLDSPLPSTMKSQNFNVKKAMPWALELNNGKYCTYSTLAAGEIAGQDISYRCDAGAYVMGEIDRSSKNWFVLYHGHESLFMKQVRVRTAWY